MEPSNNALNPFFLQRKNCNHCNSVIFCSKNQSCLLIEPWFVLKRIEFFFPSNLRQGKFESQRCFLSISYYTVMTCGEKKQQLSKSTNLSSSQYPKLRAQNESSSLKDASSFLLSKRGKWNILVLKTWQVSIRRGRENGPKLYFIVSRKNEYCLHFRTNSQRTNFTSGRNAVGSINSHM